MTEYVTGISLRGVRKLIEDRSIDDSLLDAVDGLLSFAVVVSPIVSGPAAIPLLGMLEWKSETIKLAKGAIKALTKSQPKDYLDQATRLAAANCLLTFTAYFDALQQYAPKLMKDLRLSEEDKARIADLRADGQAGAPARHTTRGVRDRSGRLFATDLASEVISVPHPADSDIEPDVRRELYGAMSDNFLGFLTEHVESWRRLPDATRDRIRKALLMEVPDRANALYDAEFLGMAIDYRQFFLWSVLTDQAEKDKLIRKVGTDIRTQFELVGSALNAVDIGLQRLNQAVSQLPPTGTTAPADPGLAQVAAELHRAYADLIGQPVIDDTFSVDDGTPQLSYPTKAGSYVPQGYRVAIYRKAQHLDREDGWDGLPVRSDLGPFLMAQVDSPYSVQTPLLILGHPGSGKSLLTEVFAARLAHPAYTTVRVELRDVDPDTEIQSQIEAQIYKDTGREVNWVDFAGNLAMSPPVVILDGYDELLQATGKLHADYLDRVRKFQHRCAVVHHRPVRVIVTSRITLIDKAIIPPGTTIIRLEEFDQARREAWTGVWNEHNAGYFRQAGIQPFSVPDNPRIEELARQPLLLLMLAIYDSTANKLITEPDMDQTRLYDELLARFIERELAKDKDGVEFRGLPERERKDQVDKELERLGVAAIGMFNRQTLVIQGEQLNADLAYFDAQRDTGTAGGRRLSQADLLLGSFFFIHESRSTHLEGTVEQPTGSSTGPSAFEFLHNTFGEFLAADFILRKVLDEAETIHQLTANPRLSDALRRELAGLPEAWFACLIHTPLHTRPVILDMLNEWGNQRLGHGKARDDLLRAIDVIVLAQLQSLLNDSSLPVLSARTAQAPNAASPYTPLPALGQLAVYSLNLILLRCYLSGGGYDLDESALGEQPDGCRAWDRLAALWRSWFPPESLAALASCITATRQDGVITLTSGEFPLVMPHGTPLASAYNAGLALADDLTVASLGLHLAELYELPGYYIPELRKRLHAEQSELLPIIDFTESRTSKCAPTGLPIFSSLYKRLGWINLHYEDTHESSLPSGQDVSFAEMTERMLLAPSQRIPIDIPRSELDKFANLSRYAAEVAVDFRASLEPRWLPYLLLYDEPTIRRLRELREKGQGAPPADLIDRIYSLRSLLTGPAGAPALRGALRHFVGPQLGQLASQIELLLSIERIQFFDIDTAASVALIAWRGEATDLCASTLDFIIDARKSHQWALLDIPEVLWEGLADLVTSPGHPWDTRRNAISALLDREIGRWERNPGPDNFACVEPLVQGLRIGQSAAEGRLSYLTSQVLNSARRADRRQRRWFLLLIRWAREAHQTSFTRDLLRTPFGHSYDPDDRYRPAWLYLLGAPAGQDFSTFDVRAVSPDLTIREADDLQWAINIARQTGT